MNLSSDAQSWQHLRQIIFFLARPLGKREDSCELMFTIQSCDLAFPMGRREDSRADANNAELWLVTSPGEEGGLLS